MSPCKLYVPPTLTLRTECVTHAVPLFSGETQQWTPEAEQLNGRLAMVGLAGMMGLEALTGGPLIPHP